MHTEAAPTIYGLVAEFKDQELLLAAANKTREAGYKRMDAYSPFPVHGLAEAIGFHDIWVPWTIFICGVLGCIGGYALQYWVNVVDYPLNIGGRPFHSWPSFMPVTFECTILLAAFGAVFGMMAFNGLPRPHHPIFNTPRFELASQDRFFLCIEADDPSFELEKTRMFMDTLEATVISEVEN